MKRATGAVPARRTRTRRVRPRHASSSGTQALERNTWTLERVGSYFKSMRRHDPEKATDEIIGSPGGATSNEAAGVRRGLFQHGA